MFRPFVERTMRREMVSHLMKSEGLTKQEAKRRVGLVSHGQFMDKMEEGRIKLMAEHHADMPAYCMVAVGQSLVGAVGGAFMDRIRELWGQFQEWLKTPQGQIFLTIVKALIAGLITILIFGS